MESPTMRVSACICPALEASRAAQALHVRRRPVLGTRLMLVTFGTKKTTGAHDGQVHGAATVNRIKPP
jgi:hypothetical protein